LKFDLEKRDRKKKFGWAQSPLKGTTFDVVLFSYYSPIDSINTQKASCSSKRDPPPQARAHTWLAEVVTKAKEVA
jgi:hypothetical protein